jgi:short-subunit dehydrogenase
LNNSTRRKVVIITGASSGIGAAVARRLARDGMCLALVARRLEKLEQVASEVEALGGEVLVIQTDVRNRDEIQHMLEVTLHQWGHVDVLINNAGVGGEKLLLRYKPEKILNEIQINLLAVIQSAQLVLPVMLRQKSGHIINVASIAGLVGLPGSTIYCATKSGVIGFSDALGRELHGTEIHVSVFCPGFTPTEITLELKAIDNGLPGAPHQPGLMPVSYVADQLAHLIYHPRRRVIIPYSWNILVFIATVFPGLADTVIRLYINGRTKGKR